jgi:hypothetical protein
MRHSEVHKIYRRTLLSWMGVSVAGAIDPLSAANQAQLPKGTGVVALESFCVADAGQMPRCHSYIIGALLPLLNQVHNRTGICLDAIVAPHTPQALLLSAYSSFDEMLEVQDRIASHPSIRQARADLESARILSEVRSDVLIITQEYPQFPAAFDRVKTGVFELRSYHAPAWHDGPPSHVSSLFSRSGIHPIVNAATAAGEHMPRFTYLIPFTDLAARHEAWSRIDADPEWIGLQRESAARHGSAAQVTGKSIYKLAPYSQLA